MNLEPLFKNALKASRELIVLDRGKVIDALLMVADEIVKYSEIIISENRRDLALMDRSDPRYDRLLLTPGRIEGIASDMRNVAHMPDPVGKILSANIRPNGLRISKVTVPFGVIGVIYESRPNVTLDVFSLCIKSGNTCILKGGSDAINSNRALVGLIKNCLGRLNINPDVVTLMPAGRKETIYLLNARSYVDLIIPRGSRELIDFVRVNSVIPVIETGAGVCHTYLDEYGDKEKGRDIIFNAKTRRVSVCNALDCLIIHESRLDDLPYLVSLCSGSGVEIFADKRSFSSLKGKYPSGLLHKATKESFGTEFLSYRMAVKTVASIDEALEHIGKYGSGHSEAIISENDERTGLFLKLVDASSVYSNTSTAFTDGGEFGLGAEIGISTQKLHARGPMALDEMTTYKWIIEGTGQIRK